MKKWDNCQSTWKSRFFVAAVAAAAAASASIGVSVTVTAASGRRSITTTTTTTTTVTTTASTFVVCPVPSISSSSSSISLSDYQRCRRDSDRKKGPPPIPIFLPSKKLPSSSLSLNNSEQKLFDELININHRQQQLPPPTTITDDQNSEADNTSLPPLSESDALRILRRVGSSSFCRTPLDVLHILRRASNTNLNNHRSWQKDTKLKGRAPEAEKNNKEDYYHSYSPIMVDDAVDGITPKIAAAALRLLSSPPFLHVPSSSSSSAPKSSANVSAYSKGNRYYRWGIRSERLNRHEGIDDDTIESTESTTTTTTTRLQTETNAYERMMSQLLKKMNVPMKTLSLENHSPGTSDGGRGGGASTWGIPVLLPRRDGDVDDTMRENAMDPNALTDLLYALSNLAIILAGNDGAGLGISSSGRGSIGRDGGGVMIEGHLLTNISPSEQGSIMDLFDSVIGHISRDDLSISEFARIVGPRRLVRDVVRPMAGIETSRRKMMSKHEGGGGEEWIRKNDRNLSLHMDRLLAIVSSYLALPHSLEQLTATDLSDTLWCFTKLTDSHTLHCIVDINTNNHASLLLQHQITMPQRKLLRAFMKRLRKYPIRSAAGGRELVRAMWSAARLIRQWEDDEGVLQQSKVSSSSLHSGRAQMENRLLPLPMRLPGEEVDDEWDSIEASFKEIEVEVDQSQPSSSPLGDLPTSILRKEAIIMFHTLINEIVHPPNFPRRNEESSHDITTIAKDGIKLHSIDLGQVADILQVATDLRISGEDMKSALVSILQHLTGSDPTSRNDLLSRCRSCRDISRVLFSLQRLRVGTGIFDNDAPEDKCSDSLESRSVMLLGERFLEIVNRHKGHRSNCCDGKTLAIILRSGVMMFRETNPATTAMLDAATILILNGLNERRKDEDWSYSPFLSRCNEFEVSSFLFAFAMARRFDQEIFTLLTDQMTEDILDSCTASSASRTMWSCAMLLSLDGAGTAMNTYKLIDLFHQISPLLLSSSLSPTYVSGAMWAMAKSEYVVDKGIFDHLAQSAASDEMLQRSNTRIVSQALWSCAKMVAFETPGTNNNLATLDVPPYINACYKYTRFIVENGDRISPKQLSRSIWAIGRLRLSDAILIQEMGDMAMRQSHAFDSRDIANVVWGLSKVNYERPEALLRLAKQVTFQANELTAQEASMILFALGKLQIHDKDVFESLYSSISSSPQTSAARLIPFASNSFLIW